MNHGLGLLAFGCLLVVGACETSQSVETEIEISELQAQVAELETQLDYAYTEMSRLSSQLSANVSQLEASISDIDRRVLDMQGPAEPLLALRELEAAVAVTNQRMAAVRAAADEFAQSLEF